MKDAYNIRELGFVVNFWRSKGRRDWVIGEATQRRVTPSSLYVNGHYQSYGISQIEMGVARDESRQ